jgi:hypothetical protein
MQRFLYSPFAIFCLLVKVLALSVICPNLTFDLRLLFSYLLISIHTDIDNPEQDTWHV